MTTPPTRNQNSDASRLLDDSPESEGLPRKGCPLRVRVRRGACFSSALLHSTNASNKVWCAQDGCVAPVEVVIRIDSPDAKHDRESRVIYAEFYTLWV